MRYSETVSLRRLAACLLVALVCAESSGAARAFGEGSTVHCCCGDHAFARACRCAACPVVKRRAPRAAEGDRWTPARECGASTDDAGLLMVLALPLPAPFSVEKPAALGRLSFAGTPPPRDRLVDAGRPPP